MYFWGVIMILIGAYSALNGISILFKLHTLERRVKRFLHVPFLYNKSDVPMESRFYFGLFLMTSGTLFILAGLCTISPDTSLCLLRA
jgi:hypothetical protein